MPMQSWADNFSCIIGIPSIHGHNNHYHLVLYLDPLAPLNWSDGEIAEKWLLTYPGRLDEPCFEVQRELKKQAIMADKKKLQKYRQRFGSLSWFMSRLNEPLAKTSNAEDFVSGRFWESRYTSVALLDESAVLSCMAYVDLNPIRAGNIETSHPDYSHYLTSISAFAVTF
jgi:hypothetical protein